MIEIPWQMCGTETLGVSPVSDATSPHNGRIPIPPIMDTQLDQIVIQSILTPLRLKVVRKFEELITPAKPDTWWEVYLSAFIMLNHIERLAMHSVAHARTHTMSVSAKRILYKPACGANIGNRASTPTSPSSKAFSTRPSPSSPAFTSSATALCRSGWIGRRPRSRPWPSWSRARSSLCRRRRL